MHKKALRPNPSPGQSTPIRHFCRYFFVFYAAGYSAAITFVFYTAGYSGAIIFVFYAAGYSAAMTSSGVMFWIPSGSESPVSAEGVQVNLPALLPVNAK